MGIRNAECNCKRESGMLSGLGMGIKWQGNVIGLGMGIRNTECNCERESGMLSVIGNELMSKY